MYDSEGGIFGDGHQSYAEGFRSADLTGYGFAGTTINNPKIINTFQRMDILRLEDNCFNVLGARDYATNVTNKTPYSIARVGEIQMFAKNIALDIALDGSKKLQAKSVKRARNYMGLANNIHYVGAVTSNVPFNEASKEAWRNDTGEVPASGDYAKKSYLEVKQSYIDQYKKDKDEATFQKRNEGTAKNMIGIASGYALKIQNVQELYDANKKIVDKIYYGPIYGVIEMNLIDVREDEGGGYVYADNVHKRDNGNTPDFLETTQHDHLRQHRRQTPNRSTDGFRIHTHQRIGKRRVWHFRQIHRRPGAHDVRLHSADIHAPEVEHDYVQPPSLRKCATD